MATPIDVDQRTERVAEDFQRRRSVGFPSALFPAPPAVALDVPESWLPVTPQTYMRFGPKVDLAMVGPELVDGVRPSVVVIVTRTDPSEEPRRLLSEMVVAGGDIERLQRGTFGNQGQHFCHAVGYEDVDEGRAVRRLQCLIYFDHPSMAHVITVLGSVAASDADGLDELSDIIGSVRFSLTSPIFSDFAEVDHG